MCASFVCHRHAIQGNGFWSEAPLTNLALIEIQVREQDSNARDERLRQFDLGPNSRLRGRSGGIQGRPATRAPLLCVAKSPIQMFELNDSFVDSIGDMLLALSANRGRSHCRGIE